MENGGQAETSNSVVHEEQVARAGGAFKVASLAAGSGTGNSRATT
jgi:hypothetical protein